MRAEHRFGLLLVCFFLSGFAALIYQTAWTRQFAFVFGTSELAVATVLAAYMGGLAAGAAIAGRLTGVLRRPVLVYGLLELGIAVSALAVPFGMAGATGLYVALFGVDGPPPEAGGLLHALFYLGASFVILLVPTAGMGATLPLLARHAVRRESEIGPRVAVLYATNTVGAVAGTLAAAFVLLPAVGLERTVFSAAGVNALVFVAAAFLARGAAPLPATGREARRPTQTETGGWILPLIAVSGAVSFAYEVLWTRLLGHLLGGSVYGFAAMLASFLAGIALGSAAAARIARDPQRAARGFAWAQLGTAGASLLAYRAMESMPELSRWVAERTGTALAADAAVAMATLLPAALCIGATFPLAVRVLARDARDAAPESARVYAWNTLGAIVGAVGAGFFLLPALGFTGVLALGVAANLALAVAAALAPASRAWAIAGIGAVGLLGLVLVRPDPPWTLLRSSVLSSEPVSGRVVHFGVGRSATVLLIEQEAGWRLRSNGLPESRIVARGGHAGAGTLTQWLGGIAGLVRPELQRMLVVGLGGGMLLESLPPSLESVDVVELEPEVIRANRVVAAERRLDPLADPRVRLVENDARGALLIGRARYDAIVSQPSHPWTAGASHLFTREFFELARERLEPSGVLVQWMGLGFVDADLVRTLVATLVDIFPHVEVVRPVPGGLIFLASEAPLDLEAGTARAIAAAPESFAELGIFAPEDVVAARVLDASRARAFAEGAPRNTDGRNLLQMRSLAVMREDSGAPPAGAFGPFDPLVEPTPGLDRVYLVRRLLARGFRARARRVAEATEDPAQRAAALGMFEIAVGRRGAGLRRLDRALELDPESREARAGRLRLRRRAKDPGPLEAALLQGWASASERDWDGLRSLEPRLVGLDRRDPFFPDAARLRIEWRLAGEDPARVLEAVALADALIPVTRAPGDAVLRARGLAAAGDDRAAFVSLFQTLGGGALIRRGAAREALKLLGDLSAEAVSEAQRQQLEGLLRSRLRGPR